MNQKYMPVSQVTEEVIASWKEKYGAVYEAQIGDETVYLRSPRRNEMGAATQLAKGDPVKFTEALLKACWLAGDRDKVFADEAMLNAAATFLDEIVPMAEKALKKL